MKSIRNARIGKIRGIRHKTAHAFRSVCDKFLGDDTTPGFRLTVLIEICLVIEKTDRICIGFIKRRNVGELKIRRDRPFNFRLR